MAVARLLIEIELLFALIAPTVPLTTTPVNTLGAAAPNPAIVETLPEHPLAVIVGVGGDGLGLAKEPAMPERGTYV